MSMMIHRAVQRAREAERKLAEKTKPIEEAKPIVKEQETVNTPAPKRGRKPKR